MSAPTYIIPDINNKYHICTEVDTGKGYKKLVNEHGATAILVTCGYGSGWSTNYIDNNSEKLLFDSRLFRYKYCNEFAEYNFEDFLKNIISLDNILYMPDIDTWNNLVILFVPSKSVFKIRQYDGAESIEYFNPREWHYMS
jgi:hypothetical protein